MNDWSQLETIKAWAQLTDLMNQMKDMVLEDARNELEVADGLSVVLRALAAPDPDKWEPVIYPTMTPWEIAPERWPNHRPTG